MDEQSCRTTWLEDWDLSGFRPGQRGAAIQQERLLGAAFVVNNLDEAALAAVVAELKELEVAPVSKTGFDRILSVVSKMKAQLEVVSGASDSVVCRNLQVERRLVLVEDSIGIGARRDRPHRKQRSRDIQRR